MFTYYIERGIEIILILDYGIKEYGFNHPTISSNQCK